MILERWYTGNIKQGICECEYNMTKVRCENGLSSDVNFGPNKRADGQADTKVHNFNILGITYMKIKIERLTVSEE